jgi:3-mercaptopyruvate sulfurtransferase SseA
MRYIVFISLAFLFAMGGLVACNSHETIMSQVPSTSPTPKTLTPPTDNARRIKADELHELWAKGDVVIIDTRAEPAYKDEHIKGAISMPSGTVLGRIEELPKTKLIAAYCT